MAYNLVMQMMLRSSFVAFLTIFFSIKYVSFYENNMLIVELISEGKIARRIVQKRPHCIKMLQTLDLYCHQLGKLCAILLVICSKN